MNHPLWPEWMLVRGAIAVVREIRDPPVGFSRPSRATVVLLLAADRLGDFEEFHVLMLAVLAADLSRWALVERNEGLPPVRRFGKAKFDGRRSFLSHVSPAA